MDNSCVIAEEAKLQRANDNVGRKIFIGGRDAYNSCGVAEIIGTRVKGNEIFYNVSYEMEDTNEVAFGQIPADERFYKEGYEFIIMGRMPFAV